MSHLLAIDFTRDWKAYVAASLGYILEGNVENRAIQDTFFLENNPSVAGTTCPGTGGDDGREGLHGLTRGPVPPYVLAPAQKATWQTYAVGFYNGRAATRSAGCGPTPTIPDRRRRQADGGLSGGNRGGQAALHHRAGGRGALPDQPHRMDRLRQATACVTRTRRACRSTRGVGSTVRLIQVDMMVRDASAPRPPADGCSGPGSTMACCPRRSPGPEFDNRWKNLVPGGPDVGERQPQRDHPLPGATPRRPGP